MSQKTNIEWTGRTWNPLAGCTAKSPGCLNCYAATMSSRLQLMGQAKYQGVTITRGKRKVFNGLINYDEKALLAPLKIKKPDTFFVNSMSDLFWGDEDDLATARRLGVVDPRPVPFEFIDKVFAVMALTPQHTYQVLTKRPERMRDYMNKVSDPGYFGPTISAYEWDWSRGEGFKTPVQLPHCNKNIWLGCSVEDQKTADERIPLLFETPAAVRWLSVEPLLGPVDLTHIQFPNANGRMEDWNALDRCVMANGVDDPTLVGVDDPIIDWVVVGGESGPNARPMHPDWARSLRDQCTAAGVSFFFKQWGEWVNFEDGYAAYRAIDNCEVHSWPNGRCSYRVGKKKAGRLLDGREWEEMPEVIR